MFATVAPGVPGRDTAAITLPARATRDGAARGSAHRPAPEHRGLADGGRARPRRARAHLGASTGHARGLLRDAPDHRRPRSGRACWAAGGHSRSTSSGRRSCACSAVEAAFGRPSYLPGDPMELTILADAPSLSLQFLHCGAETESTDRVDEMKGVAARRPVELDWTGKRSGPVTIDVQSGDWPTGLYAVRLTTPDGRVGFAPFVLRPRTLGCHAAGDRCCRRTHGRRTTSTTPTATAGATPGTPAATRRCISTGRIAIAACRRGSAATTCRT